VGTSSDRAAALALDRAQSKLTSTTPDRSWGLMTFVSHRSPNTKPWRWRSSLARRVRPRSVGAVPREVRAPASYCEVNLASRSVPLAKSALHVSGVSTRFVYTNCVRLGLSSSSKVGKSGKQGSAGGSCGYEC